MIMGFFFTIVLEKNCAFFDPFSIHEGGNCELFQKLDLSVFCFI